MLWHVLGDTIGSDNVNTKTMKNYIGLLLVVSLFIQSCQTNRSLFNNSPNGHPQELVLQEYFSLQEPVLQVGDKITVSVWGHEELSVGSVNSSFSSNESSGRWLSLDRDGEVNLPRIGRHKLAGYNTKEVSYLLEREYAKILQTPIVNVRVLSHFVTILGEVKQPGRYQLNSELVNLVQLLGQAGGLNKYAKADAIRIIRQTPEGPVSLEVDITDLVHLPKYNVTLQPDDVVYLEARSAKQTDELLQRATPIVGILTGLGVIGSLIIK